MNLIDNLRGIFAPRTLEQAVAPLKRIIDNLERLRSEAVYERGLYREKAHDADMAARQADSRAMALYIQIGKLKQLVD